MALPETLDLTAAKVAIVDEVGDTVTVGGTVTDENGDPWSWAGVTTEAKITTRPDGGGDLVAEWVVDTSSTGEWWITLADTTTATLGPGRWHTALRVTKSGTTQTWIEGTLTLQATANG